LVKPSIRCSNGNRLSLRASVIIGGSSHFVTVSFTGTRISTTRWYGAS
jgi:hypothetical protein